jgi:hypothetical protein
MVAMGTTMPMGMSPTKEAGMTAHQLEETQGTSITQRL